MLLSAGANTRDFGANNGPQLQNVPPSSLSFPSQGCYTVILNTFETYVYLAGAFAIGVLAIEVSRGPWEEALGPGHPAYFPDPWLLAAANICC